MKIRWKLLVLLLGIAVVPVVVVRAIDALALRNFGQQVAGGFHDYLLETAQADLEQQIKAYAESLDREERLLKLIVESQAEQLERRLAGEVSQDRGGPGERSGPGERGERAPRRTEPDRPLREQIADRLRQRVPVFYDTQFDGDELPAPPMLRPSELHARWRPGERENLPLPVSYAAQVVRVQPGVDRADVADTVEKLADMTRVYRRLHASFPRAILWQYSSFDEGVHFAYPGKGGYAKDFDPRQRQWYLRAKQQGKTSWSPPFRDVSTGEVVLSCATPVKGPDDRFVGVTAIDVPVRMLLGAPRGGGALPEGAQRYLLSMEDVATLESTGVTVDTTDLPEGYDKNDPVPVAVAESGLSDAGGDWRKPVAVSVVHCDDAADMKLILDDMRENKAGVRQVTVDGEQRAWGYGPLDEDYRVFLLVSVPIDDIVASAKEAERRTLGAMFESLRNSAGVVLAVILLVVAVALWASRKVSRPVTELANAARRIADGELDARVELPDEHGRDELHDMADAFNDMVPKLRDQMNMRSSLQLAMEVQQALLPTDPPEVPGYDIAGISVYCDETGGDYFDFVDYEEVGPNRMMIIVGDVVGHGIAAALLMATVRGLVRSRATVPGGTLADSVGDVNRELCASSFTGRFMTAYFLVVDTEADTLTWLSAGHDAAFVYDPAGDAFDELVGEDIPIGLESTWQFTEKQRGQFPPNTVIVMGTDGIWECRNPAGDMFGKDRLREIIRRTAGEPADAIAKRIQQDVRAFRGEREQQDDITLVVVKTTGG